jgi:phenylalanyl-tRNA synthetase beta chain
MKFSYNWLKELSGTEKSPEELAELLLSHAFEVEELTRYEHGLRRVVVGEIMKVEPHPNADRLRVTEVMLGGITCQIVCGAPNVAVGQKVAVATPGAKLPGGIEIAETEIRGVKSSGMICSEKELGLGTDASGILVLPSAAPDGVPIAELYGLEDTVLDVKILPNRGTDALSYFGLAREICALEGKTYTLEGNFDKLLRPDTDPVGYGLSIEAKDACGVYVGLVFDVVPAKESFPLEMIGKLIVSGMRSIDPATDITNYLLLLYGQPMHAFDADRIGGGRIVVRFARDGEEITLLDGSVKTLSTEDLVIADAEKPIALAGVMGGAETAITADTGRVFLEMANFDRVLVRKTRIRHGLATDAAYRFEHGADPHWPAILTGEVTGYFEMYAGATYAGMLSEGVSEERYRTITVSPERVEKVLGIPVPIGKMRHILETLSLSVEENGGVLSVSVPSFRSDLEDEWDLVEEIGRIVGYEKIPAVVPVLPVGLPAENREKCSERSLKEYFAGAGFDEIMTYSFYGEHEAVLSGVPLSAHLELENPMNDEQRYLRTKLLPQAVAKAVENLRFLASYRFFEFGRVYRKEVSGAVSEEKRMLLCLVGDESDKGSVFFSMKGEIENLLSRFRMRNVSFERLDRVSSILHPSRVADILVDGESIGAVGEANPELFRKFGQGKRVAFAEFHFEKFQRHMGGPVEAEPLSKYPSVNRDLSFLVPVRTPANDMLETMRTVGGEYLSDIGLFDVYESDKGKSMAFHLAFRSDERTLEAGEVDAAIRSITEAVSAAHGGHLRA